VSLSVASETRPAALAPHHSMLQQNAERHVLDALLVEHELAFVLR